MFYVGMDVHLRTTSIHILDGRGQTVKAHTIKGPWFRAVEFLRSYGGPMSVCFEASLGYGPLYEALEALVRPAGGRVVMAHPGRLRLIFRSKRKNDRVVALKLAKLLLLDEVPAAHVPSPAVRQWRQLIEFRKRQIDARTRIKNGLRAVLRGEGVMIPREIKGLWTQAGLAWLKGLTWQSPVAALRCEVLLDELALIERHVRRLTTELDRLAQGHAGVALLMTIPGVGPRTAEAVVAYIDQPDRFARSNRAGAYFGLVPSQDASAQVNRLGHITKQGPSTVRKLLVEAGWQVIRRCEVMRAMFDRIVGDRPERRKIAVVAVANRLAKVMLAMLRSGEVYTPRGAAAAACA